ncbi:MAG: hypothetical protein ABIH29_02095 [Candidatus Micrarchaeota archaeon]
MAIFKKAGEFIKTNASSGIARARFEMARRKIERKFAPSGEGIYGIVARKKPKLSGWRDIALKTVLFASNGDDPKIRENGLKKLHGIMHAIDPDHNPHATITNLVAFRMFIMAHLPVGDKIEGQELATFLPGIEGKLSNCLGHRNEEMRIAAAEAMAAIPAVGIGNSRMVEYAEKLMNGDEWQRHGGVLAIEKLFHSDSGPKLAALLNDENGMVRTRTFEALAMFIEEHHPNNLGIWFGKTFISPLSDAMEAAEDAECKAVIVRLLGYTHDYRAATPLSKALADPEEIVRHMAEKALLIILEHNYYDEMMRGFHSHMELGAKEWKGTCNGTEAEAELRLGRVKHAIEMKVGKIGDVEGPYR